MSHNGCAYCDGAGLVDSDGNAPGQIPCPECRGPASLSKDDARTPLGVLVATLKEERDAAQQLLRRLVKVTTAAHDALEGWMEIADDEDVRESDAEALHGLKDLETDTLSLLRGSPVASAAELLLGRMLAAWESAAERDADDQPITADTPINGGDLVEGIAPLIEEARALVKGGA